MLEQDALRFYYNKFPVLVGYPVAIADHYYLIMMKGNDILFHANSIISFCHIFDPEQFKELTSNTMRKVFPKYQHITGKGFCLSFRSITVEEFREIIDE